MTDTPKPEALELHIVHALVKGKRVQSLADVVPGAELSFDGEVRVGDTIAFGEELFRAAHDASGGIVLEPLPQAER